ncbi:MAG: hypothetical protein IPI93_07695 [Sphingobacteriaceae bacterium]|nr:hypothetical protein [Sphingobacteriaceae bacterium]
MVKWGWHYTSKAIPTQIGIDNNWKLISCGGYHNLAIKANGTLWAWGRNNFGELGDGTNTIRNTPIQIGSSVIGFLCCVPA